jgi:hypothetical protein
MARIAVIRARSAGVESLKPALHGPSPRAIAAPKTVATARPSVASFLTDSMIVLLRYFTSRTETG